MRRFGNSGLLRLAGLPQRFKKGSRLRGAEFEDCRVDGARWG